MNFSRNSFFRAACVMIAVGMLAVSCSDNTSGPIIPPSLEGSWAPVGNGIGIGQFGQASALTVRDTTLILGGGFYSVDSVQASNVAAWNGTSWAAIGSGINGPVRALATDGNVVVAGGYFTIGSCKNVATWSGSDWTGLGTGRGDVVFAVAIRGGVIFAGGDWGPNAGIGGFIPLGGWVNIDTTVFVNAFTVYDNKLIVGGSFSHFDTMQWCPNLVAIDSAGQMTAPGGGVSSNVFALTVYDGKLIAGGYFNRAGGVPVNNIAAWDGTSWAPLGNGINSVVNGLTVWDNKLIASGQFWQAGGISARHIAAWDGTSWKSLGTGMDGIVWAVTAYGDKLIACGDFSTAGGVSAQGIAAWTPK